MVSNKKINERIRELQIRNNVLWSRLEKRTKLTMKRGTTNLPYEQEGFRFLGREYSDNEKRIHELYRLM